MPDGCHVQPEQFFNLIFGYNSQLLWADEAISVDGLTEIYSPAVDPGEVWVVTSVCVRHNDPAARTLGLALYDGTDFYIIASQDSIAQWVSLDRQGLWILEEGDKVNASCSGLAANRKVFLAISGYKMKVTQ